MIASSLVKGPAHRRFWDAIFFTLLVVASVRQLVGQTILSGTYNGTTITGDVAINASTNAVFTGGANFTGTNATWGANASFYWQQIGSVAGKVITFGNGSYTYVSGINNSLTLGAGTSVTGDVSIYTDGSNGTAITNQGTITYTGTNSGNLYARILTNDGAITANSGTLYVGYPNASYLTTNSASGTITSNGSGTAIYLRGPVDNNGVVKAQNSGQLIWQGTTTTANLGNVQLATGGRALLNGTVDNTAATLASPTGGAFELYGGTIQGGTIAAGALTFTSSGGYLDGASLAGNLALPNSTYVRLTNGANFTGTTATLGSSAGIYWQQVGTLTGQTLNFGANSYLYLTGVGSSITLAPTSGATGDVSIYSDGSAGATIVNQGTITSTGTSSQIYAANFTNDGSITANAGTLYLGYPNAAYVTTNSATGTITANNSGTSIYLRGPVDNNGTIIAQNSGQVVWQGTTTTANLGTVQAAGGRALFNGTVDNTAATLNAPATGVYELYGGTILGGTIAANALTFTSSGGYLDGATLAGNLTLPTSTYVRFINGGNFTGAGATLNANAGLYWQQVGTLTGQSLNFGANSYFYLTGTGSSVTLAPTSGATGDVSIYSDGSAGTTIVNQGTITSTGSSGQIYAANFTNDGAITVNAGTTYLGYPNASYVTTNSATGTITANNSGTSIYLRGPVDNNGTVTAQNSAQVVWQGTTTTANLGNVQVLSGGHARFNGTIENTAATLTPPTTGIYELYGGTVHGGTIAPNALTFTSSGGYLDGATLTGDLALPASAYVRFINGANFTGVNAGLGTNSGIYWQQAGTLTGDALTFAAGSYIYLAGAGTAMTLAPTTTATGDVSIYSDGSAGATIVNQGTITTTGTSSSLYAANVTNDGSITANGGTLYLGYPNASYVTTNSATGSITANNSGTSIYLRGPVDNNGTITAQNAAQVIWQGTTTTANLGNVQVASGGHARFNGTIDNTGTTLNAPGGGTYELYGGTIQGGTIAANALTFTSNGGYLDGALLSGDLTIPASSYVRFVNGGNYTGTTATLNTNAGLYWQQTGTLAGQTLNFAPGAFVYITGANSTLTLAPGTTATGSVNVYTDGSAGSGIIAQGTITHTTNTGQIYGQNFTNTGAITATGGTLYLGYPSAGYNSVNGATGSITATGAGTQVLLRGNFTNNGLLQVQSGTIYTGTQLVNGATGTLKGAGTVNGDLTFAGGTLAPGNSIGALTLTGGNFTVTGTSTLSVELSGATADQILFVNPLTIDIGNGLMGINLTLLGAPTIGTTYNLMQVTAGAATIQGTIAGLPTSGTTMVSSYLGTDYLFNVSYLSNRIALISVPEPGTYALTGFGLVVLFLGRRRRRNRVADR